MSLGEDRRMDERKLTEKNRTYRMRGTPDQISGGSKGAPPADQPPPTTQIFLNFMRFSGNFNKIISLRPLQGW